ncbi:hypothetical protein INT47_000236 [Mucor saturninus]|uniref:Uncharacterized protein n=1 Tax=Mucor saturninus TaxID=64648 RepID=A0A8H7UYF2_9FUNG|nr:hypothetical protein INT47_000236 [Mucor saturninus]
MIRSFLNDEVPRAIPPVLTNTAVVENEEKEEYLQGCEEEEKVDIMSANQFYWNMFGVIMDTRLYFAKNYYSNTTTVSSKIVTMFYNFVEITLLQPLLQDKA